MALIKCKECGKDISDTVKSCPHCGIKIVKKVSLGGFLIAILFGFFVYKCSIERDVLSEKADNKKQESMNSSASGRDVDYMAACQKAIRNNVSHPSTVKHKVFSTNVYYAPSGNVAVTAPFTAKNSFGVEMEHTARCIFPVDGSPEIFIQ